nr:immunoglobulin heavy chain junction region [Macaca mulatta]MOW75602.1 immunoglobulin heavy chain junction region [Macaca mulatta]MOW76405.1 immunoglobulin heavy chain junction region [Macaca mulatta]MOW76727.1 immunoglobulin heavy chain junction region [Macaca mulatta]MOW77189.1 immunoglobulin heavy chain junction region [Macaca mulatta]
CASGPFDEYGYPLYFDYW